MKQISLIIVIIILLLWCVIPRQKSKSEPLTIEKRIQDYVIDIEPIQNTLVVNDRSNKTNPIYIIDNSDVVYYDNKRNDVISKFNREKQTRGIQETVQELTQEPLNDYILNELIGNNLIDEYQFIDIQTPTHIPGPDTQNVHDTNVQGTLKNVYNTIKDVSNEANRVFSERDVLLLTQNLGLDIAKVTRVITTIKNRSSTVSNYAGDQEYEILKSTWKAGNDNVREQIIRNLVDCIEESPLGTNVVCPTGVTSRIVESALVDTPQLMPKTRETLIQEMLSKANAVRTKLELADFYKNSSQHQQQDILKNSILESYYTNYKGILDIEQINEYVKDWINEI